MAREKINLIWKNDDPELFTKMSNARIQIYSFAAQAEYARTCYWLGNFYSLNKGIVFSFDQERATFFYYQAHISDNYPQALEKFEEIECQYNLVINTENIEEWKNRLFG